MYDTVIIGGGVTGFAAAMYAGRLKMRTLVIGETMGGTITLTNVVENYPGFKSISGLELAQRLEEHAKDYDIDVVQGRVIKVERPDETCLKVSTKDEEYMTKTVIFATGTKHRKLEVPGAEEFENKGVHYCALCDGPFYKDKVVGVVGGSDSAAKEALLLADHAEKVYIIYRGDKIRPEPINARRIEENPKIEVITNTNVMEIKGDATVNKVIFDREYEGSKEFPLDGLFIAIGLIPLSDLAKDLGVKTNERGEIAIDRDSKTNLDGVYAAGDIADRRFKQAITGVAEGVVAAYSAYQYVNEKEVVWPCGDEG
ncbi:MAG: NAD(P)/FAD-dependent oxidoreductase [Candidatus Hydrothermarchaeales archaeon]